jgi:hypothetical protein
LGGVVIDVPPVSRVVVGAALAARAIGLDQVLACEEVNQALRSPLGMVTASRLTESPHKRYPLPSLFFDGRRSPRYRSRLLVSALSMDPAKATQTASDRCASQH